MDEEGSQRFIKQVFDLWVNPELERRRASGAIVGRFELRAVQIVMNVGEPPRVRLNDEVRAIMFAKVPDAVRAHLRVGEPVYWDQVVDLTEVVLTDADPNAAHVTLVFRPGGAIHMSFDFRYNAARVADSLAVANEFWQTAKLASRKGHAHAFLENLFAAAELVAKAQLSFLPDEELLRSRKHTAVASKINLHRKLGNVDGAAVDLFNDLFAMRGVARYVHGELKQLSPSEMRRMLARVALWLRRVRSSLPKRLPAKLRAA